ncbi:type ISP restriction/modification enzyme [Streptomyces sp. CA-253872]|uniref:type ISP restriction/modification enzyme n=1 Tax=Streptomyces sp. CA-253872 TaxID=3240067 RepID=UPI003D8E22A1
MGRVRDRTEDRVSDEEPLPLDAVLPWSVPAPRAGRDWPLATDPGTARARWAALIAARDEEAREALLVPSRARTLHTAVAQLPGQSTGTGRLARESGPAPEPVRVAFGPYEERFLLPDHRLVDAPRPELWRVADASQLFLVDNPRAPRLTVTALLPFGAGAGSRVHPLFRRPGGREPNLAPGLLAHLSARYGQPVTPLDVLDWLLATGRRVRLPGTYEEWAAGTALGRALREVALRGHGAHAGPRPRLPGGHRPWVREALDLSPRGELPALAYESGDHALRVGEAGVLAPVAPAAWEAHSEGERVLTRWFGARVSDPARRGLAAIVPRAWPREWTSDLLALLTDLTLHAERAATCAEFAAAGEAGAYGGARVGAGELRAAGVLPVPPAARRPATVLETREEGPEGQFALL